MQSQDEIVAELEGVIMHLKTQKLEKEAIIDVNEEKIKQYENQMKMYRGIDLEKYRSMAAEIQMLKGY